MLFEKECYEIIGACMEVHNILGRGHKEVIYNDALEIEFKLRGIPYEREKQLPVVYKGEVLHHFSVTDFLLYEKILFETKAISETTISDVGQVVNQISSAQLRLGLLVNFGTPTLWYKRVIH